ncbi:MAG: nuclease superfamily [Thermoanaerobacter sp.]|jgi:hypothetical protein|nr:nuclease superfamily [Thermoanaerobacter sp.]
MLNGDILDILGVTDREDAYTNIIAYALANDISFRNAMLEMFLGSTSSSDDWEVKPWLQVISSQGKDVPDIVIYSRQENAVIIVENKLFSSEGAEQTERYSSDVFNEAVREQLKLPYGTKFVHVFLTLEGIAPRSNKFKMVTYSQIAALIPKSNKHSTKLGLLLDEFRQKVEEFDKWPLPRQDQPFLEYLKSTTPTKLVSGYRKFVLACNNFSVSKLIGPPECGITAHRGSGYIPLALWQKDNWYSQDDTNGRRCYEVHYEFQWDTRHDTLFFYLHYHTCPYVTRKEFETFDQGFRESYLRGRDDFYEEIHKQVRQRNFPKEWHFRKTWLQLAYAELDGNMTYGAIYDQIDRLVTAMTPLIDAATKVL